MRSGVRTGFLAAWALLFALSCQQAAEMDTNAVRMAVEDYCQRLSKGYAAMSVDGLADRVAPAHLDRLNHRFEAVRRAGRRMEAALTEIEFLGIAAAGMTEATVRTREVWYVRHLDRTSGRTVQETPEMVYRMTYLLERKDGRWIVSSAEIVEKE